MKTTLSIDDQVMRALKREAARRKTTMSELVETALRACLSPKQARKSLPNLPSFDGGGASVDVADREALYQVIEERHLAR